MYLSINELSAAYDKYAGQMDETLAAVAAFLEQAQSEAAGRAAFETSESERQANEFNAAADVETVKNMGTAAALDRTGKAEKTLQRAEQEYGLTEQELRAAGDMYKAKTALQSEKSKADVNAKAAKSDMAALEDSYDRAVDERAFARKKAQNAYAKLLADRRYELSKQKKAVEREKLAFKKS